jgi:hypothetical protein
MKNIVLMIVVSFLFAIDGVTASTTGHPPTDSTSETEITTTTLERGTNIVLRLPETVSSADVNRGDVIQLEVYIDVNVKGKTVLRTGQFASGTVRKVKRANKFGAGGKLVLEGLNVRTVDGQIILLEGGTIARDGKSRRTLAWSVSTTPTVVCIAVAAATGGVGIIAAAPLFIAQGLLIKGTEVRIEEGTLMHARILKDVKIKA